MANASAADIRQYLTSAYSDEEMRQDGELRFLALRVGDCRVPPLWRVHQRIPFTGTCAAGLAALLTGLESVRGQPEAQRPPEPVVHVLAEERPARRAETAALGGRGSDSESG